MLKSIYDLFEHIRIAPDPPMIVNVRDTGTVPLATFSRFLDLPTDIRFMIYEYLLDRQIRPMADQNQGIACEVIIVDPALAQASSELGEEARIATRQQRLGGPLVLYMINAFGFVGDLSQILSEVYESDQRHILRRGIEPAAFEHASVCSSSLTLPTKMLARVFRYAGRNKKVLFQPRFTLERSSSLIRNYFDYAITKLHHNTHVECRFLVYGTTFGNSIEFENHRARYIHDDIDWQGDIKCKVVLLSDCQATQESLSGTELDIAGDRPPMELATYEERVYMRTMVSRWQPADARTV